MARKTIKIRARELDGLVTIKAVMTHPMEDGKRKIKKTGKKIPPHFIREIVVTRNGQLVMEGYWGKSISRNPYLALQIAGNKGDRVSLSWIDNRGNSDSASFRVR